MVSPNNRTLGVRSLRPFLVGLALFSAVVVGGTVAVEPAAAVRSASPVRAAPAAEPASLAVIAAHDELTEDHARMFRLYWAAFAREPDPEGALYWIERQEHCLGLADIADLFAASAEFRSTYGQLGPEAFVHQVYRNVLGRRADAEGLAYWTGLLATGQLSRGGVVLYVSLADEFADRHRYPSDGVPARGCRRPDGRSTGRAVHVLADPATEPLATVAGLTLAAPAAIIERAGFHQSSHPGALAMAPADPRRIRTTVMASRRRGTDRQGALDVTVDPDTVVTAPVSGTVARAGSYTLYCRYRDGYVVINPDGRPDLEVKLLHIQRVAVTRGQRVEVGEVVAATATTFPFRSQIDELTSEPSWPHVHIEVVDPSVPRTPSSGGGC